MPGATSQALPRFLPTCRTGCATPRTTARGACTAPALCPWRAASGRYGPGGVTVAARHQGQSCVEGGCVLQGGLGQAPCLFASLLSLPRGHAPSRYTGNLATPCPHPLLDGPRQWLAGSVVVRCPSPCCRRARRRCSSSGAHMPRRCPPRRQVYAFGTNGTTPPADEEGFLEFLRALPDRQVYEAMKRAEPVTPCEAAGLLGAASPLADREPPACHCTPTPPSGWPLALAERSLTLHQHPPAPYLPLNLSCPAPCSDQVWRGGGLPAALGPDAAARRGGGRGGLRARGEPGGCRAGRGVRGWGVGVGGGAALPRTCTTRAGVRLTCSGVCTTRRPQGSEGGGWQGADCGPACCQRGGALLCRSRFTTAIFQTCCQ